MRPSKPITRILLDPGSATCYWHTKSEIAYTSNFSGIIPTRDDISPPSPPFPSQF